MKIIDKPSVDLVASTATFREGLKSYLEKIGAPEFIEQLDGVPSGAEEVCIVAGKLCYRSFKPGLNANVTKTRDDPKVYLNSIHKVGHGSVIEHGYVTFIFHDVSRVFTHELVRHRAGTAMSQESLRYVRLTDLRFWVPTILKDEDNDAGDGIKLVLQAVKQMEEWQQRLFDIYRIDERKNFGLKKLLTSAFRRIAPIGLGTSILWSMNMRTARHLLQMRTSRHAEEEIRCVFDQVGLILQEQFPFMFQDMQRREVSGYGEWTTPECAMPYDAEKVKRLAKSLTTIAEMDHGGEAALIASKALDDIGYDKR